MLKKSVLKKIKEILAEEKSRLVKKSYTNTDIDSIDTDGDECDEIQGNLIIGINNQMNERDRVKLLQIYNVFKKIEDGTYGICEDCEEDIPEKRLLFNPCIVICVSCAEDREIQQKRNKY